MFFELCLSLVLGICLGIITGIIPGLHINLLSTFILTLSPFLLPYFTPLILASFILSLAITHTFLDILPSTFLGVPDPSNAFFLFPSQRMVLEGRAYEAIFLLSFGAMMSLLFSFLFLPFFFYSTEYLYPLLEKIIGWILLFVCIFLLLHEKKKLWACIVFLSSGCLGIIVFSLPLEQGIFPLFSGLFGVSMLLLSLRNKAHIPQQQKSIPSLKEGIKAVPCASFLGWIASFMPGLGPAQVASLGSYFVKLNEQGYLILIGGLSTANALLTLLSLYLFQKTRSGVLVHIAELITLDFHTFLLLLVIILITGGFACVLTLSCSKVFIHIITKVHYPTLSITILVFILLLTFFLTGWIGFFILITSTALGMLPELKGIARSHMMGCLLIPVLLYFLL